MTFGAVISCISLATSHRNVSAARNAKNWYKNSPSLECEHCERVAECGQSVYFRLFVPDSIRAPGPQLRLEFICLIVVSGEVGEQCFNDPEHLFQITRT